MTFVKVRDPTNKNLVKEVLAKRNRVREADRNEKMGRAFEFEELSRFFQPVTAQTQELKKQVGELPGRIARAMPKPEPQTREEAPPAYDTLPFAGEEELPDETEDVTRNFPKEVKPEEDGYRIGLFSLIFDHEKKVTHVLINGSDHLLKSPSIYELLTNRNSKIKWDDLNDEEKSEYRTLLTKSGVMKQKMKENNINTGIFSTNSNKWKDLYSHIWHNRWLYTDNYTEKEYDKMRELVKKSNYNKNTMPETKDRIKNLLEQKYGSGVETDYVTLPSDPNELINRLELLMASEEAGNTGVHNEIVSICEELRKRKMLTRAQYKQLLSNV